MEQLRLDLLILFYVTAAGFVSAGIISSFYELITAEPAKFRLLGEHVAWWVVSFVFFGLTGPFIIMRNAARARRSEHQPLGWLFGSLLIAGLWSSCSGIVVVNLALVARYGL